MAKATAGSPAKKAAANTRHAQRAGESDALAEYARKRDFSLTSEPAPTPLALVEKTAKRRQERQFVIQKHAARRLHYDFRLELDGALKSWAVPKGPSLDPSVKRLAVQVEDHPLGYADFEGHIPEGEYGGGDVIVWDRGAWQCDDADPAEAYRKGKLKFRLLGEKLSGGWTLVRTHLPKSADKEQWLLIKENDAVARPESEYDIVAARPESVLTQKRLPEKKAPGGAAAKSSRRAPASKPSRASAPENGAEPPPLGRKASLPATLSPQLATLVDEAPPGEWRYEVKFDGYRMLARIDKGEVRLLSRNGLDWTAKLGELAGELARLDLDAAWLDGEIVIVDDKGRPDFQALQNAFDAHRSGAITYYVFDLVYLNGFDLRDCPLEARRARLAEIIQNKESTRLRYSADLDAGADDVLRTACALKLEGVIGKRLGSVYVERRSKDWIKLKCKQRQEFIVCGWTRPQGSRSGFGALLLGVHDDQGELVYAGRVGTGFSEASLQALQEKMLPLARATSPFAKLPRGRDAAGVTWVEPRLVAEIEFAEWTRERVVRHAAFRGLREDKPAKAIGVEKAKAAAELAASAVRSAGAGTAPPAATPAVRPASRARPGQKNGAAKVGGVAISHPERVIDLASGTSKLALAEYYRDVADYLLPQLEQRPVAIVRAPDGIAGEQFFQRHAQMLRGVQTVDADGDEAMQIGDLATLIGVVQMGGIEFHTWNASGARLDRPDRMIFDLDPDPALPWSAVVEATRLVESLLAELGLVSFLKTSGGKGMHVVVPLARRHGWDSVKAFSKAVAQQLARTLPERFADRMGPKNRVGKIFVDYLRNQKGGTTVAAYSVRARPGLPVSVPITSAELDVIKGAGEWTVATLADRLRALRTDPWADFQVAQSITAAMKKRLGLA